ncbi:hypothetical protein Acsp05_10200 [Actinokineospora sp. NBRC 105648]|nr:hypothetical protein Acsp05_10200 [Actinokineospora sp. NBRC 105648]
MRTPLAAVLTSMPGIGIRTAARILLEIGDATGFASSAHSAAYAGIAPVNHRSGSSIRGEHPARTGNRTLKRAFYLAAFAALSDPTSRTYYDRKRSRGQETQRRAHLPSPPLRRPLRDAPQPHQPPPPRTSSAPRSGLTTTQRHPQETAHPSLGGPSPIHFTWAGGGGGECGSWLWTTRVA